MANDKKFIVKNGLTANTISLVDNVVSPTNTINIAMDGANDKLVISGDAGDLLTVTDANTGTLFEVANSSGSSVLSVSDDGTIAGVTFIGALTGNADTATTLATSRTISLGGDLSGSASFNGGANITITATVADDSHNHVISNIDGLQTALDGKLDSGDIGSTVLAYDSNLQSFVTAFTLPTADGSTNQVLKTNGSGTIGFSDAKDLLGLYAENSSSPTAPSATGDNAVAIGFNASASNTYAIAMGHNATASATYAIALGRSADASGSNAAALGWDSTASGTQAVALGTASVASGTNSLAGPNSTASATNSVAIGQSALASNFGGAAFGKGATTAVNNYNVAIGNSYTSGADAFAAAIANNTSSYGATGANSIAIGQLAKATAANSIAIGDTALSNTANLIALGGTTDTVQISGTYALPNTDGTTGQVLTTNGSGTITFADISNPLQLYAENYDGTSTKPSATGTNAVAIGRLATASGATSIAIGNYTNASGAQSVAIGHQPNNNPTGEGAASFGYNSYAGAPYSSAIGPYSVTAGSNNFPAAIGKSYASGTDSFAAAIANNTSSYGATGANSIAMGDRAKATATYATAIGTSVTASQGDGAVAMGSSSTASGLGSFATGYLNIASGHYSQAIGYGANTASIYGKLAKSSGYFSNYADMQAGILVVVAATTDATPKALTSNKAAASTNNQVILPNNSAYAFSGTIVARQQASTGTACAAWKVEGLIRREGSAGTTVLVNSATTVLDNTPAWGMTLSADTTNGGLKIEVTGAAATNIRWVATINTSEVTYA